MPKQYTFIIHVILSVVIFCNLIACAETIADEVVSITGNISLVDSADFEIEFPVFAYTFENGRSKPVQSDNGIYTLNLLDSEGHNWEEGDTDHIVFISTSGNFGYKTEYIIPETPENNEVIAGPDVTLTPVGKTQRNIEATGELTSITDLSRYFFLLAEGARKDFYRTPIENFNLSITDNSVLLSNIPEGNWPLLTVGISDQYDETITSVDLFPLKQSPLATIQTFVKDSEIIPNTFGLYTPDLTAGLNLIQIIVTASDGITQRTYDIEIEIYQSGGRDS